MAPVNLAQAIAPACALRNHLTPRGRAFSAGQALGAACASGVLVGEYSACNRRPRSGHGVVFVPLEGARPTGWLWVQ
jgi:hypothetical protein